jgi:hypothetical protein
MVPSLTASPRVTIERSVNAFHATHAESSARATWGCGAMIDRACGYGRNAGILYAVMTSDDDLAWVHSLEWGVFITLPYSVRVPRESLAARSGRFDVAQGRLSGRTPSECGVGGGVLARQIAIDHRVEAVLGVISIGGGDAVRIGGDDGFHFARWEVSVAQSALGRRSVAFARTLKTDGGELCYPRSENPDLGHPFIYGWSDLGHPPPTI